APVVVLEAMKMEHTVPAPHDGIVTEVGVRPGQTVDTGAVLAVVEEAGPAGGGAHADGDAHASGGAHEDSDAQETAPGEAR
ncbi:MAG TPA: acetyl-CoA carboxylase biotin carboxyl carrier protein subunit, partial [Streptosporangiaceae bacterium]